MMTKELLTLLSLSTIGISGIFIITGLVLIFKGKKDLHKACMLTACAFASIFVIIYLVKSALFAPTKYAGDYKVMYYALLGSHTVLAALNLPLAMYTVYQSLIKQDLQKHKAIARYTAGVWIYVAVTGWAIYFVLN